MAPLYQVSRVKGGNQAVNFANTIEDQGNRTSVAIRWVETSPVQSTWGASDRSSSAQEVTLYDTQADVGNQMAVRWLRRFVQRFSSCFETFSKCRSRM